MEHSLEAALIATVPEPTITAESLHELLQIPKYEMLTAALDRGIIKEKSEFVGEYELAGTPEIDFEALKQLDFEIYGMVEQPDESKTSDASPSTSQEQEYVRGMLQEAIEILYTMGLANRDTLVAASKFGGPGNIRIKPDLPVVGLFNIAEYAKFLEESQELSDIPPAPTREIRDKYVEFLVGSKKLVNLINKHISELKNVGIEVTNEKVRDITTMMAVAHEYGHAIDRGFISKRRTTFGLAGNLPNISLVDSLRQQNIRVHMEHFARGIQDMVTREYAVELFPDDPEKARAILSVLNQFATRKWKDCETFLLYMQDRGRNPSHFLDSNELMIDQITEHLNEFYARGIANTLAITQYAAPAYNEQQMNYLVHTLES